MINTIDFNFKGNVSTKVVILPGISDINDILKAEVHQSVFFYGDNNNDVSNIMPILKESYNNINSVTDFSKLPEDSYIYAYGGEEVYKTVAESGFNYSYIPDNMKDIIYGAVYGDVPCLAKQNNYCLPDKIYVLAEIISNLNTIDFRDTIANVLRMGIIRDAAFYEWMILNFSEVMECNPDYLVEMLFKVYCVLQFFAAKDINKRNEYQYLSFGQEIADALNSNLDSITGPDSLALGMIATSYIAYKRQMLSMEEFYEIRDMFVPFDMTISLNPFDVDSVYNSCVLKENNEDFEMILLKKIGKAVKISDVKKAEIIEAIKQLIVEWD